MTEEEVFNIKEDIHCMFFGEPALLHEDEGSIYLFFNTDKYEGVTPCGFKNISGYSKLLWIGYTTKESFRRDLKTVLNNLNKLL